MTTRQELTALLTPAVEAVGFELWGIEYLAQGRHSILRLYIESESGVTVDDCAAVSHQVSGVLDVEDPIAGEYTLEVSSPGLDRPLFNPQQYARYIGNDVDVRLRSAVAGRRKWRGQLAAVEKESIRMTVEGQEVELPFSAIEKGRLVYS